MGTRDGRGGEKMKIEWPSETDDSLRWLRKRLMTEAIIKIATNPAYRREYLNLTDYGDVELLNWLEANI